MSQSSGTSPKRKTALVVEDSAIQALALINLLDQHGLHVISAPNGLEGVSMAQRFHPDVIILDVVMPEMDGLEACRQIKRNPQTADIPVVLLTASSEPITLRAGIEGGAIDLVPKDAFSDNVLLGTLQQIGILPVAK